MAEYLIVRLPVTAGESASWAIAQEDGALRARPERGELSQAVSMSAGRRVVVLVPGEDVTMTEVSLPKQKRQKLLHAVPYALEDQVADEVERMHFALGQGVGDGSYAVAVVARERMDHWLNQLAESGVTADMIVPDMLLVPCDNDGWGALLDGTRVLVRSGLDRGFAVDRGNAEAVIAMAARRAEGESLDVTQYLCNGAAALQLSGGLESRESGCEAGVLPLLVRGFRPAQVINLLQGNYSRTERISQIWRPWRATAALLLLALLVLVGQKVLEYRALNKERQLLTQRMEQLYREVFPQAKRVVDPRAQMQQHLLELRGGGGGEVGFLELLALSGPVFKATAGVEMKGVSYRDGRMDLDLTVTNLQVLDTLKQELAGTGQLAVEIQSATAGDDQQVKSRLRIRRAGA